MASSDSSSQRSRTMSRIRGKDTKIELAVRSEIHRRGYRYRLHARDLPGTPDLVLPRHRVVVFVNGCFWHAHGCRLSQMPASNREFWAAKLTATVERDRRVRRELRSGGWRVATVWECVMRDPQHQTGKNTGDWVQRLCDFIEDPNAGAVEIGGRRRRSRPSS